MAAPVKVTDEAFVTLATSDSYALGALVLGNSLKLVGTTRSLHVMITHDVSESLKEGLQSVFDLVTVVDVLDSQDTVNLELLSRPELGVTFTKLHCWRLTQYSKCVFLDADTLVVQNVDDLFEREELSAAPDVGWPDCFNSGVFVYRPSNETYNALLHLAVTQGSFDVTAIITRSACCHLVCACNTGGDQGLLNQFFSDWARKDISRRLPFIYNVVSQHHYTYQPAFKQFGQNTKIVHFIGSVKPWQAVFNTETWHVETSGDVSTHRVELLQKWWSIFMKYVKPSLAAGSVEFAVAMSMLSVHTKQPHLSDEQRQYNWEHGQIDYLGADSFDNILQQLDAKLATPPPPE